VGRGTGARARGGELLCTVAGMLTEEELAVELPILIVSGTELMVDEPRPIGQMLTGLGQFHVPMHAVQLASLRS
jgi:hypothetical protein